MSHWEPMSPAAAASLFGTAGVPWWIAGGYALSLVAGRSWRDHADLDVLVLRRDQLAVREVLAGWELWAADPPGTLRAWLPGEVLGPSVHDVWCRPDAGAAWQLQVMLDSSSGGFWVSRRNPDVRFPVAALGIPVDGVPCLRPEAQLFYKAGSPRDKDTQDFFEVRGLLDEPARRWLASAIAGTHSPRHPWLAFL